MFKINNNYLYLTDKQEREITKIILKDKPPDFQISSTIKGTKENKEKNKLMHSWLEKNFQQSFVNFNFNNDEAKENIINILYCYAAITKRIKISDADDDLFFDDIYLRKKSGIHLLIREYKRSFWQETFTGMNIKISVDSVERVYGHLIDFTVKLKNNYIVFRKDNINLTTY